MSKRKKTLERLAEAEQQRDTLLRAIELLRNGPRWTPSDEEVIKLAKSEAGLG